MPSDFLSEIRRRRVFRVAGVYLVAAWVAVQVAATVFPILEMPSWATRAVVIAAILGLPVALALAWAFDVTPSGIARASEEPAVGRPRIRRQARYALAAIVVVAMSSAAWYATGRDAELDPSLIVVLPFRVSGTDATLQPLGEGMVDLLSIKLQSNAGAQTTDPPAAISAWRRAGGEDGGLAEKDLLRLARQLGGARMLTGEVVSAGSRVVLRASLSQVAGGRRVDESVEGAADSVTYLVERLVRGLLSRDAGERDDRLALLTTTSLPALQQYLIGQSQYRRSNFRAARNAYLAAIDIDTTFALAAIGVRMVAGWNGGAPTAALGARAGRVAWRERERLGPIDRAIVTALLGARYPYPQSEAEQCRAWQAAQALAPGRAELLHWVADCAYHHGAVFGNAEHLEHARVLFERSLAADPAFMPSVEHLIEIAASQKDTAALRRHAQFYLATDSTSERRDFVRWLLAYHTGDSTTLHNIADSFGSSPRSSLVFQFMREHNTGLHWARRVRETLRPPATRAEIISRGDFLTYVALADGRHNDALAAAQTVTAVNDPRGLRTLVMAATYSELDDANGRAAAAKLAQRLPSQLPVDPEARGFYYVDQCILTQWQLWQRDTTRASDAIRTLEGAGETRGDNEATAASARMCAIMLRGIQAWVRGAPDLRAHALRVDSLAAEYMSTSTHMHYVRFAAARLLEVAGDPAAALRAVNRRPHMIIIERLQEARHRESGRLAERIGDYERARREYANYLSLRDDEDQLGRVASQPVRDALQRLTREKSRN